ncbi:MAG: hypothetical protein ABFD82_07855 [Syntrophaceae bacterium]
MKKLTPTESVKAYCTHCLGLKRFDADIIKNCNGDSINCSFFPYRLGKRISVKIFRKYCLTVCMNGARILVDTCIVENCPNFHYRFGINPSLVGRSPRGVSIQKKQRERVVVGRIFEQISIF